MNKLSSKKFVLISSITANIIEDVVESLIKFEDKAEEAIGELERFNDRIKEITDFEEGYNPGFFDKHEKAIKIFKYALSPINLISDTIYKKYPDATHLILTAAGCIPVAGVVFDLVDAGLYLSEGDFKNAALSGLSVVPGVGAAIAGTKIATKTLDVVKVGAKVSKVTTKSSSGLETTKETLDLFKAYHQGEDNFKKTLYTLKFGAEEVNKIDNILKTAEKLELGLKGIEGIDLGGSLVKDIKKQDLDNILIDVLEGNIDKYDFLSSLAKLN